MLKRLDGAIADYKRVHDMTGDPAMPEAIAFLEWLRDDRFIFLGLRELTFKGKGDKRELVPVKETLGILNDHEVRVLRKDDDDTVTPREVTEFLDSNEPLIVTKANSLSLVHRRSYLDYVGVKIFGEKGEAIGELRLVGLFTSVAYTSSVAGIPFIRSKADAVIKHLGFNREDHSGKALINVLEEYPRDELFQIDVESLTANAELILALGERPRVRAVPRLDRFGRFATVLVYIPRDRYDSVVREKIGHYLVDVYGGDSFEFHPVFLQNGLTRVQFVIRRHERSTPHVDREALEAQVRAIVRTWDDAVRESSDSADAKTVALAALSAVLPRNLHGAGSAGRCGTHCQPQRRGAAFRGFLSLSHRRSRCGFAEDLSSRCAGRAVAARAASGKHGFPCRQRADHRPAAGRRRRCDRLPARHAARERLWGTGRSFRRWRDAGRRVPQCLGRSGR